MVGVADWSGTSSAWVEELGRLKARISGVFGRSELRATAGAFIDGLLSGLIAARDFVTALVGLRPPDAATKSPSPAVHTPA